MVEADEWDVRFGFGEACSELDREEPQLWKRGDARFCLLSDTSSNSLQFLPCSIFGLCYFNEEHGASWSLAVEVKELKLSRDTKHSEGKSPCR